MSTIELTIVVKTKTGNDQALSSLTAIVTDIKNALACAVRLVPRDYEAQDRKLANLTPHLRDLMK